MADYLVTVTIEPIRQRGRPADGRHGPWAGTTVLDMVSADDPLRVAFELGGLAAGAIAEMADAGDDRARAVLEAKAGVPRG